MADAPHERRRHLNERAGQHIGQDQRPRSRHRLRPAPRQLQPVLERVDPRVLSPSASSSVSMPSARGTPIICHGVRARVASKAPYVDFGPTGL